MGMSAYILTCLLKYIKFLFFFFFLETESDRDSNEFEMAKQKVLTILANLDVDSKQEIVDWLKRIYFDKGTLYSSTETKEWHNNVHLVFLKTIVLALLNCLLLLFVFHATMKTILASVVLH